MSAPVCACLCAAAHIEAGICASWAQTTVTVDASRSVLAELDPDTRTVTVHVCRPCGDAQRAHNPRITG
ncbi:hypothetical protein ACIRLA_46550 [Streptomyces sp. NPDC102364]|uniref:hypothetical protein n=1 Tax=Streptomyces sp. NPDC102364 TaxID=3366161 RepID=UPI0037F7010A